MFATAAKLAVTTGILAAGLAPATAHAAPAARTSICEPDRYVVVDEYKNAAYVPLAGVAGKWNDSPEKSQLNYEMSTTRERATQWEVGGGGGVNFGIFSIEAKTKYDVTEKISRGTKVTNQMVVPGKSYGYTQPVVEIRYFHITEQQQFRGRTPNECTTKVVNDVGYMSAITSSVFFKECVSKTRCTPKG